MIKKRIIRILKLIVVPVIVFFIIQYAVRSYHEIDIDVKLNGYLVLSLIFLLAGKIMLAYGTQQSLAVTGKLLSFLKMLWIYSLSQLAKYVPGSVWQFMGRGYEYKKEGIKNDRILVALLVENVFLVLGATGVALVFLNIAQTSSILQASLLVYGLVLVIFIFLLRFDWLQKIFMKVFSFEKKYIVSIHKRIKLLGIYLIIWVLMGLSYYFLILSFGFHNIPFHIALGSFSVGWVAGFLAVFVPGGIGIREFFLIYYMLPFITEQNAFAISAFSRLSWVFVEVFLVVSLIFYKRIMGPNREVGARESDVD